MSPRDTAPVVGDDERNTNRVKNLAVSAAFLADDPRLEEAFLREPMVEMSFRALGEALETFEAAIDRAFPPVLDGETDHG